ncbi:MAG TPA: hypothetical protein VGQ81_06850 [Acidobacteriota bacterium]|jgi:hypothetical protein|nr:hypothetical protein [Acidobacteriota bacterium]
MKTSSILILTLCLLVGGGLLFGQDPQDANRNPNAASVPPGQNHSLRPDHLTPGGKFNYALHDSLLSPISYVKATAGAAFSEAVNTAGDRGFGWGPDGAAKRFGDRMGGTIIHDFAGYWVTASIFHQDPRYHHSPDHRLAHRVLWAASRVFVARGDNGGDQFNISNMVGIASSNAAQIGWTPQQDFTAQRYFRRFGKSIALNMGAKIVKEFITKNKNP